MKCSVSYMKLLLIPSGVFFCLFSIIFLCDHSHSACICIYVYIYTYVHIYSNMEIWLGGWPEYRLKDENGMGLS